MDDFKETVARRLGLSPAEVFGRRLTLAELLARSPSAKNSIDLMEAFAAAMAVHGLEEKLDIPVFTLHDNIDELMAQMENQLLARANQP